MARKVIIRGGTGRNKYGPTFDTDVKRLEQLVKQTKADILNVHYAALDQIAASVRIRAKALVPVYTGALRNSIDVHVSKSPRYPGIIASASSYNKGFDYALAQEEIEEPTDEYGFGYVHEDEKTAHYLGGSFALIIDEFFRTFTDKPTVLTPELQHAKDYILTHSDVNSKSFVNIMRKKLG